jgi:hypothetical protein
MDNLEVQALGVIEDSGPCTIVDLWQAGLERGKPLHEALRSLERDGQIENRLEGGYTPHRVYSATRTYGGAA